MVKLNFKYSQGRKENIEIRDANGDYHAILPEIFLFDYPNHLYYSCKIIIIRQFGSLRKDSSTELMAERSCF